MLLYNTLSSQKEQFTPLNKDNITMYVCGPTVYSRAHIGNARSVVVYDILYRLLQHKYPKVTYIRNITDVDDKINTRAMETGRSIADITQETTNWFWEDMAALGNLKPTREPRATEHMSDIIIMIEQLIAGGYAYESAGHVYFAVDKYSAYGDLSNKKLDDLLSSVRVEQSSGKKADGDFVLWKPSSGDEPAWTSPWGGGRPGWHIECSAMSCKHLGASFDIHGGGADLKFPHHENEIAQARAANNGNYAKYWVHNGFLMVDGQKMSKSLGNFIILSDLLAEVTEKIPSGNRELAGQIIRYGFLQTHYRKPLNWVTSNIDNIISKFADYYNILGDDWQLGSVSPKLIEALEDDINTPKAIAVIDSLAKNAKKDKLLVPDLRASLDFLGLIPNASTLEDWQGDDNSDMDIELIESLISEREQAKKEKAFATADAIRQQLLEINIEIKDTRNGTEWKKIKN